MKFFHLLAAILIITLPLAAAKSPPLTQQQLDDVRSYVANSGVAINYIVPLIDTASEEMNQYIGSGTPYNLFNKFSFAQQNQIILAVQKYAYPPPPPIKTQPSDPAFQALDAAHQKQDADDLLLVAGLHPELTAKEQQLLYGQWLTNNYAALVCQ